MTLASIFNPVDESLEAKVNAVKKVQSAMNDIQASMGHSKAKGYDSAIGMQDELKDAYAITKNSHKQALQSLTEKELQTARSKKLLSNAEYSKLTLQKNRLSAERIQSNNKSKK